MFGFGLLWLLKILVALGLVTLLAFLVFLVVKRARNGGTTKQPTRSRQPHVRRVSYAAFEAAFAASGHLSDETCTPADLRARGQASPFHARRAYLAGFVEGSEVPPTLLRKCKEADEACRAKGWPELASLPWKLALLDPSVESGFPHTLPRGIVCLPLHRDSHETVTMETLVHEKVHVLQRANPRLAQRYVTRLGYVGPLHADDAGVPPDVTRKLRSNPDLDGKRYALKKTGCIPAAVFEPSSTHLGDARSRCVNPSHAHAPDETMEHEHPYEHMAYRVAAEVVHDHPEEN